MSISSWIFSGSEIDSARHISSIWKIIVARFSNTSVTCGPTDTRRTRLSSMTRLRKSSRIAAYCLRPADIGACQLAACRLLASESRPFWKRPACDFSARASVSNHSAISSKPSSRAVLAKPGYIFVYS